MLAYAPVPVFRTCELGNNLEQSKAESLIMKWQGTVGSGLGCYHLCSQAIFQTNNLTKINLLVILEKHIQNIHFLKVYIMQNMIVNHITLGLKWQKEITITKISRKKKRRFKKVKKGLLVSYHIYTVSFYIYLSQKR